MLTARNSRGEKNFSICIRIGTMNIRKDGNAIANGDDFTASITANASTCMKVNRCIFHVRTRRTNGTCG